MSSNGPTLPPASQPPPRHPLNSSGPFYVQPECCTACDVPRETAPDLFKYDKGLACYVCRQPESAEELSRMLRTLEEQELGCIRYGGTDLSMVTYRYIYSGVETVSVYTSTGTWKQDYVYGPNIDEVLMLEQADVLDWDGDSNTSELARSWYRANALGSIMRIEEPDKTEAVSYRYDPYGEVTITRGGTPQGSDPLGQYVTYTGRWRDEETALYHYRARAYDPVRGRFLERDPLGTRAGPALYQYCESSPISRYDPFGEKADIPPANAPVIPPPTQGALDDMFPGQDARVTGVWHPTDEVSAVTAYVMHLSNLTARCDCGETWRYATYSQTSTIAKKGQPMNTPDESQRESDGNEYKWAKYSAGQLYYANGRWGGSALNLPGWGIGALLKWVACDSSKSKAVCVDDKRTFEFTSKFEVRTERGWTLVTSKYRITIGALWWYEWSGKEPEDDYGVPGKQYLGGDCVPSGSLRVP